MFDLITSIAPAIGKAIQGDFGGAIGVGLKAFGILSGSKKDLEDAIKNATPEQLGALKKIDNDFQSEMKRLDIDLEKISYRDRHSARKMRIQTENLMTDFIGVCIIAGFFAVLYFMYADPTIQNRALDIMLGALGTMCMSVVTFYFGSSAGSRMKDKAINKAAEK